MMSILLMVSISSLKHSERTRRRFNLPTAICRTPGCWMVDGRAEEVGRSQLFESVRRSREGQRRTIPNRALRRRDAYKSWDGLQLYKSRSLLTLKIQQYGEFVCLKRDDLFANLTLIFV